MEEVVFEFRIFYPTYGQIFLLMKSPKETSNRKLKKEEKEEMKSVGKDNSNLYTGLIIIHNRNV